jgi:WD40 repeat protein
MSDGPHSGTILPIMSQGQVPPPEFVLRGHGANVVDCCYFPLDDSILCSVDALSDLHVWDLSIGVCLWRQCLWPDKQGSLSLCFIPSTFTPSSSTDEETKDINDDDASGMILCVQGRLGMVCRWRFVVGQPVPGVPRTVTMTPAGPSLPSLPFTFCRMVPSQLVPNSIYVPCWEKESACRRLALDQPHEKANVSNASQSYGAEETDTGLLMCLHEWKYRELLLCGHEDGLVRGWTPLEHEKNGKNGKKTPQLVLEPPSSIALHDRPMVTALCTWEHYLMVGYARPVLSIFDGRGKGGEPICRLDADSARMSSLWQSWKMHHASSNNGSGGEPKSAVGVLAWRRDGRIVAMGTWSGAVILWDARKWQPLAVLEPSAVQASIRAIAYPSTASVSGSMTVGAGASLFGYRLYGK